MSIRVLFPQNHQMSNFKWQQIKIPRHYQIGTTHLRVHNALLYQKNHNAILSSNIDHGSQNSYIWACTIGTFCVFKEQHNCKMHYGQPPIICTSRLFGIDDRNNFHNNQSCHTTTSHDNVSRLSIASCNLGAISILIW